MEIVMSSEILIVRKIIKKTKALMFANLKVGDAIELSIPVKKVGGNRGTYASYIKCLNCDTQECSYNSFNQIGKILDCFEFVVE